MRSHSSSSGTSQPVQNEQIQQLDNSDNDLNSDNLQFLSPEELEAELKRQSILKQKRILRRYLRLKRNNFVKNHAEFLTDEFLIDSFLPKFENIIEENQELLNKIHKDHVTGQIQEIVISSYNPLPFEMRITPVMEKLLQNLKYKLVHSLPIVVGKDTPLIFREYNWNDQLVQSELFSLFEPSNDKKQVYPQVLIVPLMGFMEDCHRIGYGGGFYDRTIEQLKIMHNNNILMIGVAFEAQKFDRFTGQLAENDIWKENQDSKIAKMRANFANKSTIQWVQLDTDEPLDYIVTEKQIYKKSI